MTSTRDSIHILHVDDEPDFADMAADFLEREDEQFTVHTAENATEGLKYLDNDDFECVISDYDMPGRNGIEFLETVRGDYPDLPFILFTGKGSEAVASDAISAGVTDYLQKEHGTDQYTILANRVHNLVDRYRTHRALSERRRRLETLISNLPGFVYQCNNESGWPMKDIEGDCEEITGYHARAFENDEVTFGDDLVHPDDREFVWEVIQEAIEEDRPYEISYRIVTRAGDERWVWERGREVESPNEGTTVLEGFITDITERKEHELDLERYKAFVERSADIVSVVDENAIIQYSSPSLERILGFDPEEFVGDCAFDYFHPDDGEPIEKAFAELLDEYGSTTTAEGRFRAADGEWRWLQLRATNQLDDSAIEGVIVNARDITEKKTAERRFRTYIQHSPYGVFVADGGGEYLEVNDAACEITGYGRAELLEMNLLDLYDPAVRESAASAFERLHESGELRIKLPFRRNDGSERYWDIQAVTISNDRHLAFVEDVTERMKMKRRQKLIATSLDQASLEVYWITPDGEFAYTNDTVNERLGYSADELEEMNVWDIDPEYPKDLRENFWRELTAEKTMTFESEHTTSDGIRYPVEVTSHYLEYDGEEYEFAFAKDITERKERKHALQESLLAYEDLFNSIHDSVFVHDLDGTFLAVNDAACDRLGYEEDELLGMIPRDIDAPEFEDQVEDRIEEIKHEGSSTFETIHVTKSGEKIPVEISSSQVSYFGEEAILSVARDISERKTRERQLRRYKRAIESSTDLIVSTHQSKRIVFANEQFQDFFGISDEDLEDLTVWDFYPEEEREGFISRAEEVLQGNDVERTHVFEGADGEKRTFNIHNYPIREEDGSIETAVSVFRDVTETKMREEELAQTNALLSTIFETLPTGVTIIDADGRIIRANQQAEEVLGLTESEITERTYNDPEWEIVDDMGDPIPDDELPFAQVIETGKSVFDVEHGIKWPDGSKRWLSINAAPLHSDPDDVDRVVAVITDITEQRAAERAIKEQNERLEAFASIASHDLRNPLNVAAGEIGLAKTDCDSEHLLRVERALDRMDALIDDLLTLSRKGDQVGEREPVDIGSLVRKCWENVETAQATMEIEPTRTIEADRNRLQQLLENLVRNAVEHGDEPVAITVGELEDGLFVEDDGPGIPEENSETVFDVGYSTNPDGTGLGLNIVKTIVNGHGWTVTVRESDQGGARFEIRGVTFVD